MSSNVEIPHEVKSHPDYADGYADAFNGGSFDTGRADSEPYCYGFEAGERAVTLLTDHGFKRRRDGGVSIELRVGKSA